MSISRTKTAQEPKRQSGHKRVAAIMETAVEVFTEKGYDAATMTEIAERSGAAIASLYHFFPSKEALADALLQKYAQHILGKLAELREQAAEMTQDDLAGALIEFKLELQVEGRFAIGLADARGPRVNMRKKFHKDLVGNLASILQKNLPRLPKAKAETMAVILQHTLKGVSAISQEKPAVRRVLLAEMKGLVRAYLASTP